MSQYSAVLILVAGAASHFLIKDYGILNGLAHEFISSAEIFSKGIGVFGGFYLVTNLMLENIKRLNTDN